MNPSSILSFDTATAREPDRITVFLRECRIDLLIGYYPHERLKTQPVVVSIELHAALPHRYNDLGENSLDRVIDYTALYDFLTQDLPKRGHIVLLETLADQIINFCFQDRRITKVSVKLEKPEIYRDKARAGIDVTRSRSGEIS